MRLYQRYTIFHTRIVIRLWLYLATPSHAYPGQKRRRDRSIASSVYVVSYMIVIAISLGPCTLLPANAPLHICIAIIAIGLINEA